MAPLVRLNLTARVGLLQMQPSPQDKTVGLYFFKSHLQYKNKLAHYIL